MKFYKPDWESIHKNEPINSSDEELHSFWQIECKKWLEKLKHQFDDNQTYNTFESDNFIILSSAPEDYNQYFLDFLEYCRNIILKNLKGIATDEGFGKHAAIITSDQATYYNYIFDFFPDETEMGLSSGIYINRGYGHFVFPHDEINNCEPVAAHELTHACLTNLPIPLWLNEGFATTMEDFILNSDLYQTSKEIILKHQKYWNEENIQNFWNGKSFYNTGEGQDLSYHLARLLIKNISHDYEKFKHFCNFAHYSDGGEAAAIKYLNISLGDLLEGLLGEGNWSPINQSKAELEMQH